MILSNAHSHCWFCDGRAAMEEFVRFAIAKGFASYGFSSHAPLPYLTMWTLKEDDYDDYRTEFLRLKAKYDNEIQLYFALEVDYLGSFSNITRPFFQNKPFDYVIGSVHYVDKIPNSRFWNIDGTKEVFQKGLEAIFHGDIRAAAERYFECEKEMIRLGGIDLVAHCDKIASHGRRFKDFSESDNWYLNAFGDMLQCVKDNHLKLEINTKTLVEKGFTFPHQHHYDFIREIGVPIVVNSDCHYPYDVDNGFATAFQLLKKAGFKSIWVFYNNQWTETDLY